MGIRDSMRGNVQTLARFARPSLVPALIAIIVVAAGGNLYLSQSATNFRRDLRTGVDSGLNLAAASLKADINRSMTALGGLANAVAVNSDMTPAEFRDIAAKVMAQNIEIIRISAAPAGRVSMALPRSEKDRVLGMRFDRFVQQRETSGRARNLGRPAMTGPVQMPDGRSGFDLYIPVFTGPSRVPVFWGYIEAVIDQKPIYRAAGLIDGRIPATGSSPAFRLAIRDISVPDNIEDAFFGTNDTFLGEPVFKSLPLSGGTWQLAGIAEGGWTQEPPGQNDIRIAMALAALLVTVPVVVVSSLVAARRRAVCALNRRNEEFLSMSYRLNLALECSRIGIWEVDLDTHRQVWDERMYHLHGRPPGCGVPERTEWKRHAHPDDLAEAEAAFRQAVTSHQDYHANYRIVLPNEIRHLRHVGSVNIGADGRAKMTGVSWDVTDDVRLTEQLMEAKDRIEHNALHDPLTGLGNRRMLDKTLGDLLQPRQARPFEVALLHIDLDRFKQINDTLGHAAGDAMLIHAARLLRANVGPRDRVARIGGDEFVIVVPEPAAGQLQAMSERIIREMRQPVDYNGFACRFGVSIGIAVDDGTSTDGRHLLVNADIALYRAKQNGRNRYEFFSRTLQAEVVRNKRIADEILEGIETDQFTAWYQPQFDAHTLKLCGVEALVRWNHPRDGLLTPDRFLGIAEEMNLVATLDRIVLERALIDGMRWAAAGIEVPKISVNVSARRLNDPTLLASLDGLSFRPGQLCFELVESIFLDDEGDDIVAANIAGLKRLGIDIEMDDFGTGHTSIVSLLKIKPKRLKIDRQLVAPIVGSPKEQALVRAIIEIGRSLGIGTVAEGVETMAHAEMLALFGCDSLQGYAFAKPLPADDLTALARETVRKAS